ncbi:hypothetical protein ACERII_03490 [Evansella sp. AB-rgal1]|uniref:hypothetical protein n=1 Tax=Evansella sp. AB-rgal1 TaxID=3242696 RepID=UPI00359EA8D0
MIFEFSNDVVPILLSFSVCISILTFHLCNLMLKDTFVKHRCMSNGKLQVIHGDSLQESAVYEERGQQLTFITRIVKRKEAPEDDADYFLLVLKHLSLTTQGGQSWKTNLYSNSLKNMGLL